MTRRAVGTWRVNAAGGIPTAGRRRWGHPLATASLVLAIVDSVVPLPYTDDQEDPDLGEIP